MTSTLAAVKSTPKSTKLPPRETGEQRVRVSDIPTRGQNLAAKELLVGLASPIDDRRQVASASETRSRTSWPVVWAVMVALLRLTAGWAVEGAAGSGVFRKKRSLHQTVAMKSHRPEFRLH